MKHYGEFLEGADDITKWKARIIAMDIEKKNKLQAEIDTLDKDISDLEIGFLKFIDEKWTQEEIQTAQQKAYEYNNSIRVKTTGYE